MGQPRDGVAHRGGRAGCSSTLQVGQNVGSSAPGFRIAGQRRDGDGGPRAPVQARPARRGNNSTRWRVAPADSAQTMVAAFALVHRVRTHPGQRWTLAHRPPGLDRTSTEAMPRRTVDEYPSSVAARSNWSTSPASGLAATGWPACGPPGSRNRGAAAGDHQKHQERAGLSAGGQPLRKRQRGPRPRVGPARQESAGGTLPRPVRARCVT